VDIGPEDTQKREEPDLVPPELQDIKKSANEQVGKEVGPHRHFPVEDHDRTGNKQEKAEQQFRPVLVPTDKGKTDEQGGQKIEEAPQGDQAVIIHPLKDIVNDGLEQPVIIVPRLWWGDVGKEGVMGDCPVLPEIPPAGEVIPQVGVGHHNGPSEKIADQKQEE